MRILVIGSGIAGLSIARDLSLRGEKVSIIDKNDFAQGTTVNCAGMLHSGARYLVSDLHVANLCYQENRNMRKIAPHCIGNEQGLFTILKTDTPEYAETFQKNSEATGIPVKYVNKEELGKYEANLSEQVSGGFLTDDYVVDTRSLTACYLQDLKVRGVILINNISVVNAIFENDLWKVKFSNDSEDTFDYVINATGQDSDTVAKVFNQNFILEKIFGSMFRFSSNLTKRIVTRAAKNSAGDVVVPLADGTLIGSTWSDSSKEEAESGADLIIDTAKQFLEGVDESELVEIWTGVRTHEKKENVEGQGFGNVKRDFSLITSDSSPKFITVLPGKLTIARYVAYLTAKKVYGNENLEDISANFALPKAGISNFFKI